MATLLDVTTGEIHRYAVLIHIDTSTPARFWTGDGYIGLPDDDEFDPGGEYQGIGILTGVPAFRQLVGGTAEQVSVSFSGVDAIPKAWVHDVGSDIVGSILTLGLVFLDDRDQIASPVLWVWAGTSDGPSLRRSGKVKSVALTVGSELIDRARAALIMWTNTDQQARSSGDRFFERCSINNPFSKKWPE
jgi:hypothetical protein